MKTSSLLLAAGFILLPWCLSPLFSQQPATDAVEKQITIIKRSVDADGSEVTETIVKKGKAAENFDVDKFVRENRSDKDNVEVIVRESDEFPGIKMDHMDWPGCDDKSAFLGVEEDSDEDENQPGLVVQITRGSAAEKAGLRDNDKILQLNDTKTDQWSDLSQFIRQSKTGDLVKITYSRNGKTAVVNATLTTRKEVKCDVKCEPKGLLGIMSNESDDDETAAAGIAVNVTDESGAAKAGLVDGDIIYQLNDTPIADFEDVTDFMAYTKPGEKVLVGYQHDGQRKNVEVVLGEQKNAWMAKEIAVNVPGFKMESLKNLEGLKSLNSTSQMSYAVKEKEACLGVYSSETGERGAAIQDFTGESAAREVGMQAGDLILSVNGQPVKGHSELWDQIAKYKTGDKVDVAYEREGKPLQVQATLKACRDNLSRVDILEQNHNIDHPNRRFYTWNWDGDDQKRLHETRIIIIRRAGEGDGTKVNLSPATDKPAQDRSLDLKGFRAFPNPSSGQVTVEFQGEPVATVVSLLDISGRQLFREELNAFSGDYSQQFDLTAYAKGTIVIHVQQGDKVYTEQILVN